MRKQLLGKFRAEKDKMPAEKKTLVLTHFPRFLSLLEEEIYGESPIWDPEFHKAPPPHVQQMNDRMKTSSDTDSFRYEFMSITSSYYSGSHGIILVFDITDR